MKEDKDYLTPSEKAELIIDKFFQGSPAEYGTGKALGYAKRSALICVEEILQSWKNEGNQRLDNGVIHYWEEVIKEIEKKYGR